VGGRTSRRCPLEMLQHLSRRATELVDNANAGVNDARRGFTAVVVPLKIFAWLCVSIVVYDLARGSTTRETLAYRTVSSAIDQFWYAIFYSCMPFMWHHTWQSIQSVQARAKGMDGDWVVLPAATPRMPARDKITNDTIDDEWVLVPSTTTRRQHSCCT